MMKHEFEALVDMTISQEEYEAIEKVYMNSDLDKYDFAKAWCKMNKKRVARAKEEQKKEELKNKLFDIYFEIQQLGGEGLEKLAITHFNEEEQQTLKEVGIEMEEFNNYYGCTYFNRLSDINYKVGLYVGIYK